MPTSDDAPQKPTLDKFVQCPTYSYSLGRLVALEAGIRNQAHRGKAAENDALINLCSNNPAVGYEEMCRRVRTYLPKLMRNGIKGTHFTKLYDDIIGTLTDPSAFARTKPFSSTDRVHFLFGYDAQRVYNRDYRRWSRADRKCREDARKLQEATKDEEGGGKDEAAE
jgi:hypothetical protein